MKCWANIGKLCKRIDCVGIALGCVKVDFISQTKGEMYDFYDL